MAQQQPAKAAPEHQTNHYTPCLNTKLSAFALA
jgi:hypothetical protein